MALVLSLSPRSRSSPPPPSPTPQPADPEPALDRRWRCSGCVAHRRRRWWPAAAALTAAASISRRRSASSRSAALAFRFGLLGGGDVKLLAAGTLWLGAAALGPYLLVTVLAGGLLAVVFVAWHLRRRPTRRRRRPSLPYAVAIAAGGILTTAAALDLTARRSGRALVDEADPGDLHVRGSAPRPRGAARSRSGARSGPAAPATRRP